MIQKEKRFFLVVALLVMAGAVAIPIVKAARRRRAESYIAVQDAGETSPGAKTEARPLAFKPAKKIDIAGLSQIIPAIKPWATGAPEEVKAAFDNVGPRAIAMLDEIEGTYPQPAPADVRVQLMIGKAS